jgi:hypothetical protein
VQGNMLTKSSITFFRAGVVSGGLHQLRSWLCLWTVSGVQVGSHNTDNLFPEVRFTIVCRSSGTGLEGCQFTGLAQHLVNLARVLLLGINHLPRILLQHHGMTLDYSQ